MAASDKRRSTKPTAKQLRYLKALAERTGQTFAYPATITQASAEIDRLSHAQPSTRTERRVEHTLIADQIATGPADAAAPRPDEIGGYGSSATWANRRQDTPAPRSVPAPSPRRAKPQVGERVELGRYSTPAGDRALYGQRVDGVVRVTDRPLHAAGRSYLVERELEQDGNSALNALVADYLAQAASLAACPMSVCPLEGYLEALA